MSAIRLRSNNPTMRTAAERSCLPPFWELEDLLAAGLEREAALQVMAARRSALSLVDAGNPGRAHPGDVMSRRFKLVF